MDETGKYTEKEKEEANIKYEKVFSEFAQTKQYKAEVAQQHEAKRKANEPLNKAALEKMILIYNAENVRNDVALRDKVLKNPELSLIGLDPKAILSKHQNDFSQYLLRLSDLDELRAIRASLPKFRGDQKRQLEWVEILENKIDEMAKAPPKKPAPPKPPSAKTWKPKPVAATPAADASAPPPTSNMFAELLAKRKKIDVADDGAPIPATAKSLPPPARTVSFVNEVRNRSFSKDTIQPQSTHEETHNQQQPQQQARGTGKLKLAPSRGQISLANLLGPQGPQQAPPAPPPPIKFTF